MNLRAVATYPNLTVYTGPMDIEIYVMYHSYNLSSVILLFDFLDLMIIRSWGERERVL